MPGHRHSGTRTAAEVMGNPMGMMGKKPVSVTPNSAAELERTTGLEPATLTLAKVMVFVRGDRSARLNRLYSAG
jgi:hypothetical protein